MDASIVVGILGFAGIVSGGIFTWRGNRAVKQIEAESSPYEVLANRVEKLEKADSEKFEQIRCLQKAADERDRLMRVTVEFIDALGEWIAGGQRGKAPKPPAALRDRIKAGLWDTDPNGIPAVPDDGQPGDPAKLT